MVDTPNKLNEALDKATSSVKAAVGDVQDRAQQVTATTREAAGSVQKVGNNFGIALRVSIRDQPYGTLAIAGAVGFALGAVWKT